MNFKNTLIGVSSSATLATQVLHPNDNHFHTHNEAFIQLAPQSGINVYGIFTIQPDFNFRNCYEVRIVTE